MIYYFYRCGLWFILVLCLTLCYFVLAFFSRFSIAIISLGEERANLGAFRAFVRFVLVSFCRFPFPLGVWEGLRFVIVALPRLTFLFIIFVYVCLFMYVLVKFLFWVAFWPILWEENYSFGFLLVVF